MHNNNSILIYSSFFLYMIFNRIDLFNPRNKNKQIPFLMINMIKNILISKLKNFLRYLNIFSMIIAYFLIFPLNIFYFYFILSFIWKFNTCSIFKVFIYYFCLSLHHILLIILKLNFFCSFSSSLSLVIFILSTIFL
jgi:hypothetical protein